MSVVVGALLVGSASGVSEPLRVLAPASLTDVLPQVAAAWEAQGGPHVIFSFAGTARIAAQLRHGAPADLFFSADTEWVSDLTDAGLLDPGRTVDLLGNELVVVTPRDSGPLLDGRPLPHPLALAGAAVPAGRYAASALDAVGLFPTNTGDIVRGDHVRTVLAWVARGEAAAGVVYATDARLDPRAVVVLELSSPTPITYPVAVTRSAKNPSGAWDFVEWCQGPGRATFEAAGFTVSP